MLPKKERTWGQDPRIAYFNDLAERWDTTCQDPRAVVDRVRGEADRLQLRAGQHLLEVGCGTGQLTGWLADQVAPGGAVVAIDFAEAMLGQARRKKIRAEFRCLDICQAEVGTACFDMVLCFHSFPHFQEPRAAVSHMAHALRPGGRLIVMHLAGRAKINAFHAEVGGAVGKDHLPADAVWHAMLAEFGLEIQDLTDTEDLFFLEAGVG